MSYDFKVMMVGDRDWHCKSFNEALLYYRKKFCRYEKQGLGLSAILCLHIKLCVNNTNRIIGIISFGAIRKLAMESRFLDSKGMLQKEIRQMDDLPREDIEKFFAEHHVKRFSKQ